MAVVMGHPAGDTRVDMCTDMCMGMCVDMSHPDDPTGSLTANKSIIMTDVLMTSVLL